MMSYKLNRLASEPVPMSIVNLIAEINEHKGRQQLYNEQSPQILEALKQVAMVQSTESSNRIEGIEVPERKLKELMETTIAPQNRSEGEVAGYRDVLTTIHTSYPHIPISTGMILQFHRDLYKYVASEGGRWKSVDNTIDDVLPDGTHSIRFQPLPAFATPQAMEDLCTALKQHDVAQDVTPVLLTATFVLDFLCIHPFRDGNGRMSRLLSLLLLYQHGYEVGRYISIERVTEQSKESYYDALLKSSKGWREGTNTLLPWWEYFLGTVLAAYREFEDRVGMVAAGRGNKSEHVRRMVISLIGDFSISELQRLCPHVSRNMIRVVLDQLKNEKQVECLGTGRSARWRRTHQ